MSNCTPLRFGVNNDVREMTITSVPAPVTDLEFIKNEYAARRSVWTGLQDGNTIVIEGEIPETRIAEYFAIPSLDIPGDYTVKLEVFSNVGTPVDLLQMEPQTIASILPLGEWRAGVDPYGVLDDSTIPDTLVYWFPEYLAYKRFRLTITAGPSGGDVSLRMLMMGEMIQFHKNFDYGLSISFLNAPELVQTSSGSYLPARVQRKSRRMTIPLNNMPDLDRMLLSKMEKRLLGQSFIVSAYPAAEGWQYHEYSFLSRFANELEYVQVFNDRHSARNMTLLEV